MSVVHFFYAGNLYKVVGNNKTANKMTKNNNLKQLALTNITTYGNLYGYLFVFGGSLDLHINDTLLSTIFTYQPYDLAKATFIYTIFDCGFKLILHFFSLKITTMLFKVFI